jgi:hypothetical protein
MPIVKVNPPPRRRPITTLSQTPSDPSAESPSHEERVGYGNPPLHSRFKPGKSGNPKGRPKRSKGLNTIMRDTLSQKIIIRTSKGERRVPHIEAMVFKLIEQASKGNLRALQTVLDHYARAVSDEDHDRSPSEPREASATDTAILAALRDQIEQELASGDDQ